MEHLLTRTAWICLAIVMLFTVRVFGKENLVEVEPLGVILSPDGKTTGDLVPYRDRRAKWGAEFSITYSLFHPTNYESDFADPSLINFENLYGVGGLVELAAGYRYKFAMGSLGLDAAYGFYTNSADDTSFGDIKLNVQQIRLGGKFVMDAVMKEPYIAPYVGGGAYVAFFSEKLSGNSFNGQTDPAGYYYGGLMFQLNWLEKPAAIDAYTESGVENTYLFVEARKYLASSTARDPDFSTGMDLAAGVNLEF
jgi:hypothetical protein